MLGPPEICIGITVQQKHWIMEESLLRIVRYAAKAPSGHNTQPWKFKTGKDTITVLPDFTRALPVVDADNHALYISLGCALENLVISANELDYETMVEFTGDEREPEIIVRLSSAPGTEKSGLFEYIEKRQVTRCKFSTDKIPDGLLSDLFSVVPGVHVRLFLSGEEINRLTPYIIEGNNLQFSNRKFINELVSWLRFSEKEVMAKGDGIWSASMGLPGTGRFIGTMIMKNFVSAGTEAKRLAKLIQASAGFALFMVEKNDPHHWIKLGQAFQRFGLRATKNNISHSHLNMPCEELPVREKLIRDFHLEELTPLLLIRFGRSGPMPYSFRRNIYKMLVP
jgi:hypothetical protein